MEGLFGITIMRPALGDLVVVVVVVVVVVCE